LHIYGTPLAWQRLTADGERLLEQIATGTLISEELITFKFDALADYLFKLEQRNFSGKLVAEI
jgi:NADPH2:quinone reductase